MSSNPRKRSLASSSSQAAAKKRRTDPTMQKYYAVRVGMRPGVYLTWDECQAQTAGFKGASYKSFFSLEEAQAFVAGRKTKPADGSIEPEKFYAVARGAFTGIFSDWDQCKEAIAGQKGPKYKKFLTREEAVEFIKEWGDAHTLAALGLGPAEAASSEEDDDEEDEEDDSEEETLDVEGKVLMGHDYGSGTLRIYTDGSSLRNGKAGAAAGVGVYFGPNDHRNISERLAGEPQTNQRAELTAMLRALQVVDVTKDVDIVTDSQYSINCATVWVLSWEKKDWKTSKGEAVMNQDLVKAIRNRVRERERAGAKTAFKWVKGHSTDPGNIAADRLAVEGAKKTLW